jgi:hypothetical protein
MRRKRKMQKRKMQKIKVIAIAVLSIAVLSGCGLQKKNDNKQDSNSTEQIESTETKSESSNKNNKDSYDSIEDLPKYNNYTTYEMAEAIKQDWFDKIGYTREYSIGGYDGIDVYLGYTDDDTDYIYPDAIIMQGYNNDTEQYEQYIITKEEYATDNGEQFFRNMLATKYDDNDRIDEIIDDYFVFDQDVLDKESEAFAKLGESYKEKHIKESTLGYLTEISKQMPIKLYSYMDESKFNFTIEQYRKLGQRSTVVEYDFTIKGNEKSNKNEQIVLVYDDLEINVNMNYDRNSNITCIPSFTFDSGVLDYDAIDEYIEHYKEIE